MTYSQYQQLYTAAKKQLADRVTGLQPRAGNRASVNGFGIGIEPRQPQEEAAPPSWDFLLTGSYELTTSISGEFSGEGVITRLFRSQSPNFYHPFFLGLPHTQENSVLYIPDTTYLLEGLSFGYFENEDGEFSHSRSFRLTLKSDSTIDPGTTRLGFQFPVRVVYWVFNHTSLSDYEVVTTVSFDVGYTGASHNFLPYEKNKDYRIAIKSIERLA